MGGRRRGGAATAEDMTRTALPRLPADVIAWCGAHACSQCTFLCASCVPPPSPRPPDKSVEPSPSSSSSSPPHRRVCPLLNGASPRSSRMLRAGSLQSRLPSRGTRMFCPPVRCEQY